MDYHESVKYESSYFFVCLLTGILVSLEIYIFFYVNNIELELVTNSVLFIPFEVIILFISYIIGMFIHGIRYYFFNYYIKVYAKHMKKRKEKQKVKRSVHMRLLFYLFRQDTTIEVLLSMKRSDNLENYKWIKKSKNPVKDLWPLAINVSKNVDRGVYKFLFYSEFFQCFETTFIMSFSLVLLYNIYVIVFLSINVFSLFFNGIFLIILFILHKTSRNISMVFAKKFFLDIDSGLIYLHCTGKKQKTCA
jgi:ABC-type multidrug transport system fused ATPase/permease subunit